MWYKQPIRPMDPVIQTDQATGAIRYFRDDFSGSGQNSFSQPPAQPQDQFSQVTNAMPITRGTVEKRWGYSVWANLGFAATKAYEYQNEAGVVPFKRILFTGNGNVAAFDESGSSVNPNIFTPTAPAFADIRMVNSRSTAYFADGQVSDLIKWDGSTSGGVSEWGIDITDTTGSFAASQSAAAGNDINGTGGVGNWTLVTPPLSSGNKAGYVGPANARSDNQYGPTTSSNPILLNAYGFTVPSGTVTQLQFVLTYQLSWKITTSGTGAGSPPALTPPNCSLAFQFTKAGVPYGPVFNTGAIANTISQTYTITATLGGGSALQVSYADVNDAGFGIQIIATTCGQYTRTLVSGHGDFRPQIQLSGAVMTVNYTSSTPAITVTPLAAAGNVTLVKGRIYYYVFRNSTTGHMSDLSPASTITGAITNASPLLSTIPVCADPQVDVKWILATADGGNETTLYYLAEIPNTTTTYSDNTPELTLLAGNIVQENDAYGNEVGVADNTPPPNANFPIKHAGRLFMAQQNIIYCSKSLDELTTSTGLITGKYEEAWPATFQIPFSESADVANCLLSDGTSLYVGTNRHVWRLSGTGPADFSEPTVAFNETGVLSQEAISVVYRAGTPAGVMWLSPDLRVIASDFNTYQDVGDPIQDVLLTVNPLALGQVYAQFFSTAQYDIFVLAIPTAQNLYCDTMCVYDLRTGTWGIWKFNDAMTAMLFTITQSGVPLWLYTGNPNGTVYWQNNISQQDNLTPFTTTVRTTWLHMGMPAQRKYLNEIEVLTGDPALNCIVEGASTLADFNAPATLYNAAPVVSPLGPYKIFPFPAATVQPNHRYFRFTFASSNPQLKQVLDGYSIEAIPAHFL